MSKPNSRTSRLELGTWWLAATLISLLLTTLQLTITAPYRLTSFARMAHFNAVEPFQHRVLVPAIAGGIEHIVPLDNHLVFGALEIVAWLALIAIAYRAIIFFRITQSETLARALGLSIVLPTAIVVLMPDLRVSPMFHVAAGRADLGHWGAWTLFYYPYDLPAAAFTLALLIAIAAWGQNRSWPRLAGLMLLFAVGTVNRETTLFVIPMAALMLAPQMPIMRLGLLVGLLALLYGAVEWPLQWLFANHVNPHADVGSTSYELHVHENAWLLSHPFYLLTELVRFFGGFWLAVLLWWRFIEPRLRAAVLGLVVPLVVVGLIIGRIVEHRIFIEAVPVIWLAGLQAIGGRIRAETPNTDSLPDDRA